MSKTTLKFIFLGLLLMALQVMVFNHIALLGYAVGFIFIYILVNLPLTLSVNWIMTIGFFMGLTVDIFADTQGMNAISCTILAALRRPVIKLYFPREEDITDPCPYARSLGFPVFAKYALTLSAIYCLTIFLVESMSFFRPLTLLIRIVASTVLTFLLLIATDSLTSSHNEKRL